MRNKALGSFIKNKRLAKNISTKEAAKSLNTSVKQYTQYENGEISIYIDDLIQIADIVDVSAQELFYEYSK
ncbi:helix-turn-helix domain-containing protein [Providencia rettgeri]|uniref:helix-turn-helix domain-containing protein n=1 Tax=Providencia TaxID=586 RepID=UPI001EE6DC7C|nr:MULTISPECIES: helix-turn-helix transcriptional regulator [Providencia]EMC8779887.1 helix-turn-helix transcriptional regulator [Providencia rettgeri]MCG5369067.1 helix-turn-helix domain-containing protein [Providencia rettgeri]MCL0009207.1 helix-turn-helix domain-containing protein [Providencia rettgeri]